jgi:hypothetical protein
MDVIGNNQFDEALKEITPDDVIEYMRHKALCFDVLFYLLCVDGKTGQVHVPKNISKYKREDYKKLLAFMRRAVLQIDDSKTFAIFKLNMEKYIDGLVGRIEG